MQGSRRKKCVRVADIQDGVCLNVCFKTPQRQLDVFLLVFLEARHVNGYSMHFNAYATKGNGCVFFSR
jgi:hypothetical protein